MEVCLLEKMGTPARVGAVEHKAQSPQLTCVLGNLETLSFLSCIKSDDNSFLLHRVPEDGQIPQSLQGAGRLPGHHQACAWSQAPSSAVSE